jgi:chromosome segregation ATPase
LEDIGNMQKAEQHLRRTVKTLQEEVAVLKGSRDTALEGLHAGHRALLAEQERLRGSNAQLTKEIADAQRREKDVERRIEVGEHKLIDLQGKLTALKQTISA